MSEYSSHESVAVVGLAGRFPMAGNVEQFWQNLALGKDCYTEFSVEQIMADGVPHEIAARPDYVRRCPVISDPAGFDARLFRYSPREAELIDPQQRILLECAWEALEHAGHDPHRFPGLIGIWTACGINNYFLKNILPRGSFESVADFQTIISNDKDYLASRIAYKLDLRGPAVGVQTACSSSLVAVHHACLSLMTYQCDLALAGAVFLQTPRARGYLYREGEIFSPDGFCRTFDKGANGTVLGEGCGLVVLRRLEDAIAERDNILAVIRGSAVNNDGAARAGFTAPGVAGQMDLMTMAQTVADVSADEISYIEAHGTGTHLGDLIEVSALTQTFRRTTNGRGFCGLGSVKTNIGHLDVAAGIAGLIKTICSIRRRQLPPTLNYSEPNPELRLSESPFYVVDRLTEWQPRHGRRIAGVSSFGMGGTNAHVIIEEYRGQLLSQRSSRQWHLLPISAATPGALHTAAANFADRIQESPDADLGDMAWTLSAGRIPLRHRRCVVADSTVTGAARVTRPDALFGIEGENIHGKRPVVFLFSGQGTQYSEMGAELYQGEPVFRESMDRCSRLLGPISGKDFLIDLIYGGDVESINRTAITQPALFVFEFSLARLLESYGIRPSAVVGHSIGEYVAACEAGVFTLEAALALVRERGRLMQSMEAGAMIAVPCSEEVVRAMLPAGLDVAAVNAPAITVVSGPTREIVGFESRLEGQGILFRRLNSSHGFHSRMMESAVGAFAEILRGVQFRAPQLPLASNLSGGWIGSGAVDPEYWARHLRGTVRFGDNLSAVETLFAAPLLLEVGPGNTLCAIARQHPEGVAKLPSVATVRHPSQNVSDQAYFLRALGALWCHGADIDLSSFYAGEKRKRVPLPAYPFERERFWLGTIDRVSETDGKRKKGLESRLTDSRLNLERMDTGVKPLADRKPKEEDLIRIWCKALGVAHVGADDDFFDLGGHSLLAVGIMTELEKSFGMRLPLSLLIEAPTIRGFIPLLDDWNSEISWSNLVSLHGKGSRSPFFLMHSHGGNILEYQPLANLLKNDRPIYALQCSGLDGGPVVESSVEEMAFRYLKEIRTIQPEGPYHLGGFCFGGCLAIEMAHLLRVGGEKVEVVVLINSATNLFPLYSPDISRMGHLWNSIKDRASLELETFWAKPLQGKIPHLAGRARRGADLIRSRVEMMMDHLPARFPMRLRKHSLVYCLERIARVNDLAWARYYPKPYDGKVLFLRARRQPLGMQPDKLLGWGQVLTGDVHFQEVPGFRQNMLEEPNVTEVAGLILEHLP